MTLVSCVANLQRAVIISFPLLSVPVILDPPWMDLGLAAFSWKPMEHASTGARPLEAVLHHDLALLLEHLESLSRLLAACKTACQEWCCRLRSQDRWIADKWCEMFTTM